MRNKPSELPVTVYFPVYISTWLKISSLGVQTPYHEGYCIVDLIDQGYVGKLLTVRRSMPYEAKLLGSMGSHLVNVLAPLDVMLDVDSQVLLIGDSRECCSM